MLISKRRIVESVKLPGATPLYGVENGETGVSDIEGKAARVAASKCGQRVSFN